MFRYLSTPYLGMYPLARAFSCSKFERTSQNQGIPVIAPNTLKSRYNRKKGITPSRDIWTREWLISAIRRPSLSVYASFCAITRLAARQSPNPPFGLPVAS